MRDLGTSRDEGLPPVYAATYDHLGYILWGPEKLGVATRQVLDWLEAYPEFRIG